MILVILLIVLFFSFFLTSIICFFFFFSKIYLKNKKIKQNIEKGIFGENYVNNKLINELNKEKIEFDLINDLYLLSDFNKIDYVSQIDHILLTRKFLFGMATFFWTNFI